MNMQAILKQAQKMQKELGKAEKELSLKQYEATVGGGAVKVKVTGELKVEEVIISDELLSIDAKEDLQCMIISCVNEAMNLAQNEKTAVMNKLTGGIKMPGGF